MQREGFAQSSTNPLSQWYLGAIGISLLLRAPRLASSPRHFAMNPAPYRNSIVHGILIPGHIKAFCGTLFAFLASMVFSYAVWADNGDAAGASREA
jgi:hypothetical protein